DAGCPRVAGGRPGRGTRLPLTVPPSAAPVTGLRRPSSGSLRSPPSPHGRRVVAPFMSRAERGAVARVAHRTVLEQHVPGIESGEACHGDADLSCREKHFDAVA
ncbi:MAG: hypothetical protein WD673_15645, partial [Alphaproteobacteria bacterium]